LFDDNISDAAIFGVTADADIEVFLQCPDYGVGQRYGLAAFRGYRLRHLQTPGG